jgi:hypothetical protein
MDEFGETPGIYVWPKRHDPETEYPGDFWVKLAKALHDAGIEFERI